MSDLVDWELAERIATRLAGGTIPSPTRTTTHRSQPDFAELTAQAEELVADCTGLRSLAGPARARVADRAGWVHANIASFQRLLRPVTDRLEERLPETRRACRSRRRSPGVEVGTLLGWMSGARARPVRPPRHRGRDPAEPGHRVLRRTEHPRPREALRASRPASSACGSRSTRCTHRAQFTGVPWMREHFLGARRADPRLGRPRPEARSSTA